MTCPFLYQYEVSTMSGEKKQNIFLTGFMGAGKSTVGRQLAKLLNCSFIDLDAKIEDREQCSISNIFITHGEQYFRDCETAILKEIFPQEKTVYATGGGIVLREENRILMKTCGTIIFLKAEWDILEKRLKKSMDRPLVNHADKISDIKMLWADRQPYYRDADIIVETNGLAPLEVAHEIISRIHRE